MVEPLVDAVEVVEETELVLDVEEDATLELLLDELDELDVDSRLVLELTTVGLVR